MPVQSAAKPIAKPDARSSSALQSLRTSIALTTLRAADEVTRAALRDYAFYKNPYFVPITHDEVVFQIGPYRRVMDAEISLVAKLDGVPVAFIVAVPDCNPLLKKLGGMLGPGALVTFLRERRGIRDAALSMMGCSGSCRARA
jgi:hypothetical protein